jgi:membrane protein YqaA with SNARE-associated domain
MKMTKTLLSTLLGSLLGGLFIYLVIEIYVSNFPIEITGGEDQMNQNFVIVMTLLSLGCVIGGVSGYKIAKRS